MTPPPAVIKLEDDDVEMIDPDAYQVPENASHWQPILHWLNNQTDKPLRQLIIVPNHDHPGDGLGNPYGVDTAFFRVGWDIRAGRIINLEGLAQAISHSTRLAKDPKMFEIPRGVEAEQFPDLAPVAKSAHPAISTMMSAWLKIPMRYWSNERKAALVKLNRLMRIDCHVCEDDWPRAEQIPHYLRALDQFFFAGLLQEHVLFHPLPHGNRIMRNCGLRGITRARIQGDEKVRIAVDNMAFYCPQHHQRKRLIWMGTLLHEMAHALFQVYGCPCNWCAQFNGESGHGLPWQEVSNSINRFLRVYVDIKEPPLNWTYLGEYHLPPDDLGVKGEIENDLAKLIASLPPGTVTSGGNLPWETVPAQHPCGSCPDAEMPWEAIPSSIPAGHEMDFFADLPEYKLPWEIECDEMAEEFARLTHRSPTRMAWEPTPSSTLNHSEPVVFAGLPDLPMSALLNDPFMGFVPDTNVTDWAGLPDPDGMDCNLG